MRRGLDLVAASKAGAFTNDGDAKPLKAVNRIMRGDRGNHIGDIRLGCAKIHFRGITRDAHFSIASHVMRSLARGKQRL